MIGSILGLYHILRTLIPSNTSFTYTFMHVFEKVHNDRLTIYIFKVMLRAIYVYIYLHIYTDKYNVKSKYIYISTVILDDDYMYLHILDSND
jgi:hypothetical protein